MIASGTLKYKLNFYNNVESQSDSGAITRTKTLIFSIKAAIVKQDNFRNENAKELFFENILTFKFRHNKLISDTMTVNYNNSEYAIVSLIYNAYDNSDTIIIKKENK